MPLQEHRPSPTLSSAYGIHLTHLGRLVLAAQALAMSGLAEDEIAVALPGDAGLATAARLSIGARSVLVDGLARSARRR